MHIIVLPVSEEAPNPGAAVTGFANTGNYKALAVGSRGMGAFKRRGILGVIVCSVVCKQYEQYNHTDNKKMIFFSRAKCRPGLSPIANRPPLRRTPVSVACCNTSLLCHWRALSEEPMPSYCPFDAGHL